MIIDHSFFTPTHLLFPVSSLFVQPLSTPTSQHATNILFIVFPTEARRRFSSLNYCPFSTLEMTQKKRMCSVLNNISKCTKAVVVVGGGCHWENVWMHLGDVQERGSDGPVVMLSFTVFSNVYEYGWMNPKAIHSPLGNNKYKRTGFIVFTLSYQGNRGC